MTIEARKISLAQKLFLIQQESVLDKIEELLNEKAILTPSEKNAIDEGINSIKNGRIPHREVMENFKSKFPKLHQSTIS